MMCEHFEDLILEDLDGRLAPQEKPALANHLAGCENCRAFVAAQIELDGVLSELPKPQLSAQFASRVLRAVQEPRPATWFEEAGDLVSLFAVAAAGALAVSFVFPNALAGLPWAVAALIFSGGVWLTESLDLV
jgi:anti-sigma factor RsiW